jgi:phosphopantothenoylcysteine decarboxylase/phosphopantothenate--cysteine ligase
MVGPAIGALAGPDVGVGRMAEVEEILGAADEELGRRVELTGCDVVVTAAGTREPIDAMRFIGNASSGMMGYELAFEAVRRNARVTLVTGPTHLTPPDAATVIRVTTADEMREAVMKAVSTASILIMAAAVSDWRPAETSRTKLKKSGGPPDLKLEPTADILAEVGESRRSGSLPELKVLVGYCAETENLEGAARKKLERKSLDLAVANLVGAEDSGVGLTTLRALTVDREGRLDDLGLVTKKLLARRVIDRVAELFGESK